MFGTRRSISKVGRNDPFLYGFFAARKRPLDAATLH